MLFLGASTSHVLTPQLLEVAAGLVVLACAATSAVTLPVAWHRWRENVKAGEEKPTLFARIQLRNEALLFAGQIIAVIVTVYRVYNPDILSSVARSAVAVLIAVALWTNRRDFRKL